MGAASSGAMTGRYVVFPPLVLVMSPAPPEMRGTSCPEAASAQSPAAVATRVFFHLFERDDRSDMPSALRSRFERVSGERLVNVSGLSLR